MIGQRSETLHKFLTERGYKQGSPDSFHPRFVVAQYYRTAYGSGVPDCLTNDKPPQFVIRESSMEVHGADYRTARIGVRNEAPQGWVDFQFYSLKEADLMEHIDDLEVALLKAWSVLFQVGEEKA